jgi:3-mercaptopyruvate sulfurtransferase SseA
VADVEALTGKHVFLLKGGTATWIAAGFPVETGERHLASPRIDRYRRPYEGTDAPREAMQAYLDWEYGLVDQLARDGTHDFFVI